MTPLIRKALLALLLLAIAGGAYVGWQQLRQPGDEDSLASGNGRIEATEIDIATKLGGRVDDVLVSEGEYVAEGQPLVRMQVDSLQAQRDEAQAGLQQAREAVAGAEAQVALRESDHQAALAQVTLRESERDAASRRLARSESLAAKQMLARQTLDDDRTALRNAEAALAAARAQAEAARAAITAARTQVTQAQSAIAAAEAAIARIEVEINDTLLRAPREGRVQYLVARPGEVLGGGGKVLNLVDLTDVYMTFFLPETVAGRVAIGSEARIVLDAAPDMVIPAAISFVASTAQFTPKTVETASERQKLMFRVKAQIDRGLLLQHLDQVKTGLPGVAWVKLDPDAPWPARLAVQAERE